MSATPFTISSELGRDDRIEMRSWLRAFWQRLVTRRRGAQETRSVLAEIDGIDFVGRFTTVAGVRTTLQRYSLLHGGKQAAGELEKLRMRVSVVNPPAIYRRLLQESGCHPEEIATWVRSTTLHVNRDKVLMPDGGGERPFTPLETALTGVGQCTAFAALAAALIETAGYPTRLWSVPGHTFLEWRRPDGRWQLEDVDVLPPDAPLPRGMSMRSLLENYPEWARILDALPCLNMIVRAHCFVPTDGGNLICWRHPITAPTQVSFRKDFTCGSMPRETRLLAIAGVDAAECAVLIDNQNPSPRVLVICEAPFQAERTRFDDNGIQHDIYAFARARTLYDRQFSRDARRLYALVPGGAKRFPVPVGQLGGAEVSAFVLPADNAVAHPYLIAPRIALPAAAAAPPDGRNAEDDDLAIGTAHDTDVGRVLAEFHRVLLPGEQADMSCRADGWYHHMAHRRGVADPDTARFGRDALYGTVWRRCAAASLAPLRKSVARRGLRLADPAGVDVETLLDEMDRHLRDMNPDDAATVRRLELRVRDACGDGQLATVLADILANAACMRQGPTVAAADQAWQPEEVAELAVAAGFSGFTWWSAAGSLQTPGLRPLEIGPMLETPATARRHFRGALTVWHCLFTKA